ncbi:hypothetical protein STEG23_008432, partial [Scotinomys teguina]
GIPKFPESPKLIRNVAIDWVAVLVQEGSFSFVIVEQEQKQAELMPPLPSQHFPKSYILQLGLQTVNFLSLRYTSNIEAEYNRGLMNR